MADRRVFIAFTLLVSAALPLNTNAQEAHHACSAVSDALARLSCFDKAFPKAEVATGDKAQVVPPVGLGAWKVTEQKSPLDDSVTVTAFLDGKEVSGTGIGDPTITIAALCRENTTSFVVVTGMFMAEDQPKVTYRLGTAPAVSARWNRSTDYKAVGLWSGSDAIPFLRALKDGEALFIRVEEKNRVEGKFDLASISAVRAKIASACGWEP